MEGDKLTTYSVQPTRSQDQIRDRYIRSVLSRYETHLAPGSPAAQATIHVAELIRSWAGKYLIETSLSGSHAKGTAVKGANDIDLFVSLRHVPGMTLRDVYNHLEGFLNDNNLKPERRRVALKVRYGGVDIDVVPARKSTDSSDHWLYHSKRDSWIKTNVFRHIRLVTSSKRIEEIRAIKIWRVVHRLDFPSLYLELTVLNALRQRSIGRVSANVWSVLGYLARTFATYEVLDPANTNNIISSDLTIAEKRAIVTAAKQSLEQRTWDKVIW